jgi:aminoglycoside phosphotransferase family enzyme/predicted kinase
MGLAGPACRRERFLMSQPPRGEELPAAVRGLLSPRAYGHPAPDIRLIQTHISYVVLAGAYAYKLRKPVDLGFLDFTSLEARRLDCEAEVRVNSRACQSLYYGVEALRRDGDDYHFGGEGETVDFAVKMRRLPSERMLAALLARGQVDFEMVGRLVWKVARFHQAAEGGDRVRRVGGLAALEQAWSENLRDLEALGLDGADPARVGAFRAYGEDFWRANRALLLRREEEGRVRDCHGDLRADSVCFDDAAPDGICLFDALEFSERLRFTDTGLDIAFLAMDVERRGFPETAAVLLSLYTAAMGDSTLPLVSSFFLCHRALVRAKVAGILAGQAEVPAAQREGAQDEAALHLRLAAQYARPNAAPAVVVVMGLSGTGKSVLAGAVAHRIGAALLSTDIARKELAGSLPTGRHAAPLQSGLYAPSVTERVYSALAAGAEAFLRDGRAVVLDGTFLRRDQRATVTALRDRFQVPLLFVECTAPEALVRERQEQRSSQPWTASDATWEVYLSQKSRYQPPLEARRLLSVDTSRPLLTSVGEVVAALAGA